MTQRSRGSHYLHPALLDSRTSHQLRLADLATLIALADTDEVVRLRLLRAIRDLVVGRPSGGAGSKAELRRLGRGPPFSVEVLSSYWTLWAST